MPPTRNLIFSSVCIGLIAASPVHAQERKLTRGDVPPSVLQTADREAAGATVKGYSTEREHGKTVYEVETELSGHSRDLQISGDGALQEIEEEVALNTLKTEVQNALTVKAKGAQIVKVESLTKQGKLVAYEAATRKGNRKGEVQVGPSGETLTQEE